MKLLSRLHIDGFILGIFLMVGLASLFPAHGAGAEVLGWAVKIAIGLLFLLYGMRLHPREALEGLKHWRLHSVVLASTFILFPAIGIGLRVLAPGVISQDLYTGILFMCLVPSTVQSSIAFTSIARGNVAAAVVSASFSNLLGVFLTPALVLLLLDTSGRAQIDASSILDIVLQLLVPFLLGQLLRPWFAGWVKKHAKPTKIVDRGSILLVVYSAFSEGMNQHIWSKTSVWQILVVVGISAGILAVVLCVTALVGRQLGFSWPDRIVIIFCGSKKSLATGLPMASVLFAGSSVGLIVLPLMIFHQMQLIVCAWLAQRFAVQHPEGAAKQEQLLGS